MEKEFSRGKSGWVNLLSVTFIVLMISLLGCGSNPGGLEGGKSSDSAAEDTSAGDLFIGLTDNAGDFGSYKVDVVSIELEKKNGAVVETLPLTTSVDFAQYTEMTEFLTACTIPSGVYVKASMKLDFSNADIRVEDESGALVKVDPKNIQDEDGNQISELTVSIHLDDLNALLIKPGVPAHLALDFDLKASNTVEWEDGSPVVTVSPVLLADLEPHPWKINRVRGPLDKVQPKAGWFDIIIRPFVHAIHKGDISNRFGTVRVYTTDETLYVIDGKQYQGDAGLEQLDGLTKYSAVLVFGDFIKETGRLKFRAREVLAGSSVAGGTLDVVAGNVIKRTLNETHDTAVMRGATLIREDGTVIFHDTVTVDLSGSKAGRQYTKGLVPTSAISVGQRLVVFGVRDGTSNTMVAKYAHMYLTTVNGIVNSVDDSRVAMDLNSIDGRSISIFDFTGTNADPDDYLVGTGMLSLSGISAGTPLKAFGFPTPFAESLPDDFTALSIIDVSKVRGIMAVGWGKEGTATSVEISEAGLELNLENAGKFHHLNRAGVVTDLSGSSPAIVPKDGSGAFCISNGDNLKVFSKYDAFADELAGSLEAGARVRHLVAAGIWDDTDIVLRGRFIAISMTK